LAYHWLQIYNPFPILEPIYLLIRCPKRFAWFKNMVYVFLTGGDYRQETDIDIPIISSRKLQVAKLKNLPPLLFEVD